ncbi:MAG: hypothetical protein DHS20C02_12960 [Micavibrio sp.]|nr:MAG: hypothetical protein DHS20C02_12960 [Micavibrio sp.]
MSNKKSHIKTKAAAVTGAAVVALSGFVPQPLISSAQAATATISVTGSFITGIALAAGANANFGSVAATAPAGSVVLATTGAITASPNAVAVGGAVANGSFVFTAVDTTPNINMTVTGLGAVVLAATGGGNGPVGTMKLANVSLGGIGAAAATFPSGGGTTATVANYNITSLNGPIAVGATVTWGAVQPIGLFSEAIVLTAAY